MRDAIKRSDILNRLKKHPDAEQAAADLIEALVDCVGYARAGLPPVVRRSPSTSVVGRKRKPGGGRKHEHVKEILISDVVRALRACQLPTSVGGRDGTSLAGTLAEACWLQVTGKVQSDWRRVGVRRRRWE